MLCGLAAVVQALGFDSVAVEFRSDMAHSRIVLCELWEGQSDADWTVLRVREASVPTAEWFGGSVMRAPDSNERKSNSNKINDLHVEKVGFQARSLRHCPARNRSPDSTAAGFFRCVLGLCGRGCLLALAPGGPNVFSPDWCSPGLLTALIW